MARKGWWRELIGLVRVGMNFWFMVFLGFFFCRVFFFLGFE